MQKVLAILLLFCLSLQCTVKLGIVAWFKINQDYIAKNICINRDKPQMKCNGKCHLKKQLKKVENDGSASGKDVPTKLDKVELTTFIIPQFTSFHIAGYTQPGIYNPVQQRMYGINALASVFHPPLSIVA